MVLRLAIKVAYYNINEFTHGFQIQPNVETVFSYLEKALISSGFIEDNTSSIDYAGRTDHGVNALGQVIAINLSEKWDKVPERFLQRINVHLPKNIRCWAYSVVNNEFHPRYDAIKRIYVYIYSINKNENLELELMKNASKLFHGLHNFINFAKNDADVANYNREILKIGIEKETGEILISLDAKSFLWQQCRRITSHLIQVGKKQATIEDTKLLLTTFENTTKPSPLPAENLILTEILYHNINFKEELSIKLKIAQSINEDIHQPKLKVNSFILLS